MTEPISDRTGDGRPRDFRERQTGPRGLDTGTLVWGVILIAVGLWFFLDQTLGIDLPTVDWGDVWPLIVIAIGIGVLAQGVDRRTR